MYTNLSFVRSTFIPKKFHLFLWLGKNLEVRHGIVNWLILDDKPGSISSGGGANSMYPGDPLAAKSVLRSPTKKSWGFGLSSNYQYWTSLNLNFECLSP